VVKRRGSLGACAWCCFTHGSHTVHTRFTHVSRVRVRLLASACVLPPLRAFALVIFCGVHGATNAAPVEQMVFVEDGWHISDSQALAALGTRHESQHLRQHQVLAKGSR